MLRTKSSIAHISCIIAITILFITLTRSYQSQSLPLPIHRYSSELFNELVAADKFARCGFLRSSFLPDYSGDFRCESQPYIYTHMPAGPSIIIGILKKNYLSLSEQRAFFSFICLLGILSFYFFLFRIFSSFYVAFFSVLFLITSYSDFLVWSDHFVHSFYWICLFGTILLFFHDSKKAKIAHFFMILLTFATNFFCGISVFIIELLICISKKKPKKIILSIISLILFVVVRLTQNFTALGGSLLWKDFIYTFSNRIFATPTRDELAQFYHANHIVLWGVNEIHFSRFSDWIYSSIEEYHFIIFLTSLAIALQLIAHKKIVQIKSLKALLCFLGIFSWTIFFLPISQFYLLPYLTRTGFSILLAVSTWEIFSIFTRFAYSIKNKLPISLVKDKVKISIAISLLAFCEWNILISSPISTLLNNINQIYSFLVTPNKTLSMQIQEQNSNEQKSLLGGLDTLRKLPKESSVWTNFDISYINFETTNFNIGSCSESALKNLDITKCRHIFISELSSAWEKVKKPEYIFLSAVNQPGDCGDTCTRNLARIFDKKYQLIAKDSGWWIFKI